MSNTSLCTYNSECKHCTPEQMRENAKELLDRLSAQGTAGLVYASTLARGKCHEYTNLAMGFTGPKAARFKEAYIAEFNRMEEELYRRRFGGGQTEEAERLRTQCEIERKRAATAIGNLRTARASEEKMKHQLNKALDIIARLTA